MFLNGLLNELPNGLLNEQLNELYFNRNPISKCLNCVSIRARLRNSLSLEKIIIKVDKKFTVSIISTGPEV